MRRGLYRFTDPEGEPWTCVDWSAGDGAPFLSRSIYEMLGFKPRFDELPDMEKFLRKSPRAPLPFCLRESPDGPIPTITG